MPKIIRNLLGRTVILLIFLILISSCSKSTKTILIEGIVFEDPEIMMEIGDTRQLQIIFSPDNATNQEVDWINSDNNIATVSGGIVTALLPGVTTITATTKDGGHNANCRVIVQSEDSFVVGNRSQWEVAIDAIKNGIDISNYNIIVINDFNIMGSDDFTFGDRTDIEVSISGAHTISLSTGGYLLRLGSFQNLKVTDTLLLGFVPFNFDIRLIIIEGEGAIFTLAGNASVQLPIDDRPQRRGVDVYDTAEFYLKDNASIKHTRTAVYLYSGGRFFMSGGVIEDNIDSIMHINYSGVRVNDGFFEMTGGRITGNYYHSGGSTIILENESIFNMYGGEISENNGGISIQNNATFNMYGGIIINNNWAVGISANGTFELYNGSISNNDSAGVSINNEDSIFKMRNGTISGNSGVGVFLQDGLFMMIGGIIYGNEGSIDPGELKNIEGALNLINMRGTAIYEDGSNILPHVEGELYFTDYTITVL